MNTSDDLIQDYKFEKPIVVIGIGHRYGTHKIDINDTLMGASTSILTPATLSAISGKNINISNNRISEFELTKAIAFKVQEIINNSSEDVTCMRANRMKYISNGQFFDENNVICGTYHRPSSTPKAIINWNNTIGNGRVCAYAELHFDGAGKEKRGGFIWCSDKKVNRTSINNKSIYPDTEGIRLGRLIRDGLKNAIPGWVPTSWVGSVLGGKGVSSDHYKGSNDHQQENGNAVWRNFGDTNIASCLVEMFNGESPEDANNAIANFDKLCLELANALITYATGKGINLSSEELKRIAEQPVVIQSIELSEDQKKDIALKTQRKLTNIEQRMGVGGDSYHMALRNSTEIIGTSPNPTKPFRSGRTVSYKTPLLKTGGIIDDEKLVPSVEKVIRDYPTGNKFIQANGQYNITAGELNLVSQGNTLIKTPSILELEGGPQISFTCSDNLTVNCSNAIISSTNTTITGNTSINGNVAINGGMLVAGATYVDGGVSASEFNGPYEIDNTNAHALYGYLAQALSLILNSGTIKFQSSIEGTNIHNGTVFDLKILSGDLGLKEIAGGESGEDLGTGSAFIKIPPHRHQFKRLKGTLANNIASIQEEVAPLINQ